MYIDRVTLSDEARSVIEQLREQHGELIFHQSGGCCDGSAPMCFQKGDFLIGSRDLCLGEIHGLRQVHPARQMLRAPARAGRFVPNRLRRQGRCVLHQ